MSSLYEKSTDKLGKRVVVRGGALLSRPHPFLEQASGAGQIFKDGVNGFPPPRIFIREFRHSESDDESVLNIGHKI